MEIEVTFDHGKLTFSPDPAIVRRGSYVNWSFYAKSFLPQRLRWVVYFASRSPFRGEDTEYVTDTPSLDGQIVGSSRPLSAEEPGDYKYGVRVVDLDTRQTLGDDDPRLIVK